MKYKVGRNRNVFFTSDEHYGHRNVIRFCRRPYEDVDEMDEDFISKFNETVPKDGLTFHGGDFCLWSKTSEVYRKYVSRLNGNHVFLMGSHDRWLNNKTSHEIIEIIIDKQPIVICHYAMRVWHRSHYNSWLLYGHSHGNLPPEGKSWDIGVDTNGYRPLSFDELRDIMNHRPDNFNLVKDRRY